MELIAFCNKEFHEISMRISALMENSKRQEDRHRRNGRMSTAIVSGIAIAHTENVALARAFLESHGIPGETVNRVLSGKHRKTDL